MPFYEYQCTSCGHEEEVLQKISDKPLKKCSECGKATMKKKVSAAAFRLKGGGWYETDFKSGSKKNVAGDEKVKTGNTSESKDKNKTSSNKKPAAASTTSKKVKS
jgi:putative FmdB family regulatory protein